MEAQTSSFSRNAHQVLDLAAEGGEIKRLAALGVENPVNSKTGMAGTPLWSVEPRGTARAEKNMLLDFFSHFQCHWS